MISGIIAGGTSTVVFSYLPILYPDELA